MEPCRSFLALFSSAPAMVGSNGWGWWVAGRFLPDRAGKYDDLGGVLRIERRRVETDSVSEEEKPP
ncbi:hypothetical protein IEQ34_002651 [Dendrobium chrysotoxum]|uniref:Uncharacterized protein n=1 Tax=Dendrobium chrysotoxum TaxID=161865 RepID=A0AAV7HJ97_DENCH|nr:hypothetical protein IEQ34_002651 [Dendrobium chrysotoxum]